MQGIIDFHTHAFPDDLADRAMTRLREEGAVPAYLDARISSLLESMDRNGIEQSVVCSIATRVSQYDSILKWSLEIQSERIIPFPSLHPDDPEYAEKIHRVKSAGLKGIKLHPYFQNFTLDQPQFLRLCESICRENLILVLHTGFDLIFPRERIADPVKIRKVVDQFPELKLVTTHLGAWRLWDEMERFLLGRPVYMEISYALEYLSRERARQIFLRHPPGHILFGSDSPWTDQGATLALLRNLKLEPHLEKQILGENARLLLATV